MDLPDTEWDYSTACQTALDFGLTSVEVAVKAEVTRGDLAVMLYRALGNTDASSEHQGETLSRNADGSINPPADGSQYIPQVGDVIRCDDGTNYTITDVSRWDKNMFASGPIGPLPEPTCDWSLLEQPELPKVEVRHFQNQTAIISVSSISMKPGGCFTHFTMLLGIAQPPGKMERPNSPQKETNSFTSTLAFQKISRTKCSGPGEKVRL